MSGIEELQALNQKLGDLLAGAEPGIYAWRKSLHDTLLEMAAYSGDAHVIDAVAASKRQSEARRGVVEWRNMAGGEYTSPNYLAYLAMAGCAEMPTFKDRAEQDSTRWLTVHSTSVGKPCNLHRGSGTYCTLIQRNDKAETPVNGEPFRPWEPPRRWRGLPPRCSERRRRVEYAA